METMQPNRSLPKSQPTGRSLFENPSREKSTSQIAAERGAGLFVDGPVGNSAAESQSSVWATRESKLLASYAMFSSNSEGRRYPEELHDYRSPFQRDRDRILHSAAFRRLSGKMQVFTGDMGDYHRTRLTHTHEVATVARTVSRALALNEDLTEALALFHDIGHPPYGHSGEDALNDCMSAFGGFSHNAFARVLAEQLETRYTAYAGLNLSSELLHGQDYRITHDGWTPLLEVQIVDLSDSMTYNAHDVDDALTLGLLQFSQLQGLALVKRATRLCESRPRPTSETGRRKSLVHSLINVQVNDLINHARTQLDPLMGLDCAAVQELETTLQLSDEIENEKAELASFLFENVYRHPQLMLVRREAATRVERLFEHLCQYPEMMPDRFLDYAQGVGIEVAAGHYIAGMTDRFCDSSYEALIEAGETKSVDW
ncbi:MAG: dGTP triphosphohydrolase [Aureliella sp.]